VLKSVSNETRQCDALHDLVVEHMHTIDGCQAFNLRQEYVRVQVIVGKDELLELCEFL
jgi:hypothetical protein